MQYQIWDCLEKIVVENIKNNVFSACSVGIIEGGSSSYNKTVFHYGDSGRSGGAEPLDDTTIYDLASLTKPLVTVLSVLALVEMGKLKLSDPLADYFDVPSDRYKQIQIHHLLEHKSGLPAHREYFKQLIRFPQTDRLNWLIDCILNESLEADPGCREVYSDLGYILLGKIVENVSGEKLNDFWQRTVISPLGLEDGLFFNVNKKLKGNVVPATGYCQWSNRELCGLVNDDNCRSLGGVAGHAGLFGSAEGLVQFCEILLKMYDGSYNHPALSFDLVRRKLQNDHGRWILGFDTPTGAQPSSGNYFSDETIGHLGFTGTSFWLDCRSRRGVVLLTNRVLYSDDVSSIRKFRPLVHNTIIEKLTDEKG